MNMNIDMDQDNGMMTSIKVVGVGGGGCNAINRMTSSGMSSVEFISVNTDGQSLRFSNANYKLHIGDKLTRGQGAGGDPSKGEKAAEESAEDIQSVLKGTDMVYITAGMGGGTGTGAAPVIARLAKEQNILTVGVVTKPFEFEGRRRMQQAESGIKKLCDYVDALLVIPNERLRHISAEKITLFNAFVAADEVLTQAVQSISDLINIPGVINLDFADVTAILKGAGYTHMGIGRASGKDKAEKAALAAISSPLLETSINGAKGVIVNFLTSPDVDLADINTASTMIHDAAHEDVNLIWGVAFDEKMEDEISIVVIATNFDDDKTRVAYTETKHNDVPAYELHAEVQPQPQPEPEPSPEPVPQPVQPEPAPEPQLEPAPAPQPEPELAPRRPIFGAPEQPQPKTEAPLTPDEDEIDIGDIIKILNNRLNNKSDEESEKPEKPKNRFFDDDDDKWFSKKF